MTATTYPLEPLVYKVSSWSVDQHRQALGIGGARFVELNERGLTAEQADRFAGRLGFHPSEVWDDWSGDITDDQPLPDLGVIRLVIGRPRPTYSRDNLRERRLALGLRLRDLAREVPCAYDTLVRWESGKLTPRDKGQSWVAAVERAEVDRMRLYLSRFGELVRDEPGMTVEHWRVPT